MLHLPWMNVAFEALVGALLEALTKRRQRVCLVWLQMVCLINTS